METRPRLGCHDHGRRHGPRAAHLQPVRLRQGRLAEAETALRDSLARVRNNGWALAGLAEVYKRKGDARAEQVWSLGDSNS